MNPQQQNPMPAGAPQAAPAAPAGGQGQAAPPQGGNMEQFSEATRIASNTIYDEEVFKGLVDRAKEGSVSDSLATTIVLIITEVESQTGPLSLEHLFSLAMMMAVDVADALTQGGIEVAQEDVDRALSDAITMFLQQNQGRFSREELDAAVSQLQETANNADAMEQQLTGGQGQAPQQPPTQGGLLTGGMA